LYSIVQGTPFDIAPPSIEEGKKLLEGAVVAAEPVPDPYGEAPVSGGKVKS
jgi:hypothetical protein